MYRNNSQASGAASDLIGRVALAVVFLSSAVAHTIFWKAGVQQTSDGGIPLPGVSLLIGLLLEYTGGIFILLGWKTRVGAALLLIFTILATAFFKRFWSALPPDPAEIQSFLLNIGLMGGLLVLVANGAGPLSLDRRS